MIIMKDMRGLQALPERREKSKAEVLERNTLPQMTCAVPLVL